MPLQRSFKSFWNRSQTKAWGYLQLGGSGLLFSMGQINKVVSDPTFKSYLDQLDVPKSVIIGLALFGLVTYVVHGHGDD